jgi:hypothetical protein
MKPGGSKAKGNQMENRIAKELSLWLTANDRQDVLERSPASGAKFTIHQKRNRDYGNIAGDLIAVSVQGQPLIDRFVIEIKHRDSDGINISNLIYQTATDGLVDFWRKLLKECEQTSKLPMLVFRQNNRPIMIMLCQAGAELFEFKKAAHCVFRLDAKLIYVSTFEVFKEFADPKNLTVATPVVAKTTKTF